MKPIRGFPLKKILLEKLPLKKLWRDRKGVAALELGLIAVPFLSLTFGVVEFGRLMWTREALEAAAIAGARCMGVRDGACASSGAYNSGNTTTYIDTVAGDWSLALPDGSVVLDNASTTCVAGVTSAQGFSKVTITYTFTTMVPDILTALADASPITVSACFPNRVST